MEEEEEEDDTAAMKRASEFSAGTIHGRLTPVFPEPCGKKVVVNETQPHTTSSTPLHTSAFSFPRDVRAPTETELGLHCSRKVPVRRSCMPCHAVVRRASCLFLLYRSRRVPSSVVWRMHRPNVYRRD